MNKDYKPFKERVRPDIPGGLKEDDTRVKLIDPQLRASGWAEENIRRSFCVKVGKVIIEGNTAKRGKRKYIDYVLFYNQSFPIAVIEAKREFKSPADGISQAKEYAQLLGVYFAYSTNGEAFEEFDFSTNRQTTLEKFPFPEELYERWQKITSQKLPDLTRIKNNPMLEPLYYDPQKTPRYYQLVAINRVIEAILKGQKRILLTMATGTGKTYVASQIVYKLWKSKYFKRFLYLTDRAEVLRDQAYNEFKVFGDARVKILGGEAPKKRDIYFATYQTLYSGDGNKRLYHEYPSDFFDMVIIDECHRSGWNKWYEILEYFNSAVHFGMTATPKRTDNIDTYKYFGEPVFEYNIDKGIEDGYLANYLVQRIQTNVDKEGVNLKEAELMGAEVYIPEDEPEIIIKDIYKTPEFEKSIILPDRTKVICEKICELLERYGPMDKTIIYCVSNDHALEVKKHIQNHFSHLGYSNYAVRIVAEDEVDKKELENFRDSEKSVPVVATTVDLLTTGVDIPPVRNIIILKTIQSVVLFNQIIGRGTRIDETSGKLFFRIIDFTGATRLLPELREIKPPVSMEGPFDYFYKAQIFDAETGVPLSDVRAVLVLEAHRTIIKKSDENGIIFFKNLPRTKLKLRLERKGYNKKEIKIEPVPVINKIETITMSKETKPRPKIKVQGIPVYIETEEELLIEAGGRKMTQAEYREYSREGIRKRVINLDDLRKIWIDDEKRQSFILSLLGMGISPELLSKLTLKRTDIDTFDILAHIAFDAPVITRDERARVLIEIKRNFINSFSPKAKEIILDLIDQYRIGGVEELRPEVFTIPRFMEKYGGLKKIAELLGTEDFIPIFNQLKEQIYAP